MDMTRADDVYWRSTWFYLHRITKHVSSWLISMTMNRHLIQANQNKNRMVK